MDAEPAATVANVSAYATGSTSAVLSGSFSGASAVPSEVGFYWGTSSSSLTNKAIASAVSGTSGTFTATLKGLTEGETYVYQAYAIVNGTGTHASEQKTFYASAPATFKMTAVSSQPAVPASWLELPSATEGSQYITDVVRAGVRNYTHLYDTDMFTSMWTAYPLYASVLGSGRTGSWVANPYIDTKYQINLTKAYVGYSRGHMIPNGSRNGNSTMQAQTFYWTNSVPQIQDNFNGGIWSELENAVRSVAKQTDTLYVVTGVAFRKVGGSEAIKKAQPNNDSRMCPVPNYFYKVALKVKRSGSSITDASAIGFWFDHKAYPGESNAYANYSVSVDQIEQWTGLNFFVNLPEALQTTAEANSSWTTFKNF